MKILNLLVLLLLFVSCAGQERKEMNEVYIPSGAEQYFLPNLPAWANISTAADCRRNKNIRFFDFWKLNQSYKLTYEQLVQFQVMFNYELLSQLQSLPSSVELRPRDEEVLFFNVLEKVQGGSLLFLRPEFKDINLVWVDDVVKDKVYSARLKKLMAGEQMDQGFPVMVSSCLSLVELEQFVKDAGLPEGTKMISAEFFSPYDPEFSLLVRTGLDIDKLFKENQRLNFFSTRETIPAEIRGHIRLKRF